MCLKIGRGGRYLPSLIFLRNRVQTVKEVTMKNNNGTKKTTASVYYVEFLLGGVGDMSAQSIREICYSKEEAEARKDEYDLLHNHEQTAIVGCY